MKELIQQLKDKGFESLFERQIDEIITQMEANGDDPKHLQEILEQQDLYFFYLCDVQRWLREGKGVHLEIDKYTL